MQGQLKLINKRPKDLIYESEGEFNRLCNLLVLDADYSVLSKGIMENLEQCKELLAENAVIIPAKAVILAQVEYEYMK